MQGGWILVGLFLGGNIYFWTRIPQYYLLSGAYWISYALWAIVGGWLLLPKKLGVNDQASRLNPVWVAVPALGLIILSTWFPALSPLYFSFFGVFLGVAIRLGLYLLGVLFLRS